MAASILLFLFLKNMTIYKHGGLVIILLSAMLIALMKLGAYIANNTYMPLTTDALTMLAGLSIAVLIGMIAQETLKNGFIARHTGVLIILLALICIGLMELGAWADSNYKALTTDTLILATALSMAVLIVTMLQEIRRGKSQALGTA